MTTLAHTPDTFWRTILQHISAQRKLSDMISGFAFAPAFSKVFRPAFSDGAGVVAGPTTLIEDAFTGADGTSLTAHVISPTNAPGAVWLNIEGAGGIIGNRATSTTNVNVNSRFNLGIANLYTITAILRVGGAVANSRVAFRGNPLSSALSNYWIAGINGNTQVLDIYSISLGVATLVDSEPMAVAINTDYAITVVISGTSITVTIGAAICTASSALHQTLTYCGISVSRNGVGGGFVDNLKITTP